MLKLILGGIAAVGLLIGGLFSSHQTVQVADNTPSFGAYSPTGGSTYRLGQSIGTSDTTIKLSSFKEPVSNIPYTMSYLNSDIEYGTLSPQSSVSEFISFSGITQNGDGSATLTGVLRGISRTPGTGGCVASTTLAQSHAGQSIFILSNPPCQIAEYPGKRNTEYITGAWGFQGTAPTSTTCATAFELCNKTYVDSTANAGAATSTETNGGIVELGTLAEQASSFDGGATKPTVLQTKNSTSSCQVVGTYNIVASSTTGKLSDKCFDQTYPYRFTGTTTFATTTVASTTETVSNIGTATINTLVAPNGTFDYQVFTSSGTWTKPVGASSTSLVVVEVWGGGGGGGASGSTQVGGGGGGGAFSEAHFRLSDLGSTVTVTVGGGGTSGVVGGNTTFGALLTGYGGGNSLVTASSYSGGGGGGGVLGAGLPGASGNTAAGGGGGGPLGGAGTGADGGFGGAGGGSANAGVGSGVAGGNAAYGGGGGGGSTNNTSGGAGGISISGGGGGGGAGPADGAGGTSNMGGTGGSGNHSGIGVAGSAPGGGGGGGLTAGGAGGRGEVRVWVLK